MYMSIIEITDRVKLFHGRLKIKYICSNSSGGFQVALHIYYIEHHKT